MKRPGRNEPCHCGSGKKFKQCCASHDEALASNANAEAASQKFHVSQALQAALAHHQAGRLPQAEEIYRQILQIQPNHPNALHLLGVLAHQAGQNEAAADLINKATQANPTNSTFHDHLGTVYQALNRLDDAVACHQRALALKPGEAETHYNLGNAYRDQGRRDESAACYQKSLALKPNYAEAHNNLGNAFRDQGKLAEAVACFQKALAIKPDYADAHNNLGNVFNDLGRLDKAIASGQQALTLNPDSAEAHNNLGNALYAQGNLVKAADRFRQALALKPDYAEAYNNLGNVFKDQGKHDEAVTCFQKAATLKPDFVAAFNNLGAAFDQVGLFGEAIRYCQKALEIDPYLADGHNNLGIALCGQGQINEAIASYRTALEIDRNYSKAHSSLIFTLDMAAGFDTPALQQERKNWGEIHAAPLTAKQRPHTNATDPARRLRIGYVSADFRRHSATTAFGAMLVKFDRDRFEVFAYSNSPKEDDYTQLFQQNVTAWRKIVGLSDDAVAEMIREDGIDILVDLSGHTAGNRLLVFARKPAPVQVTAWGCPSGTGMQAMDALFADPVVIPPEEKQFYTEQVRYLPNLVGFFSPEIFPTVGALPALSAKTITFGSFNRLAKVSRESFELWARVLTAVPGSRLMLKTAEFDDAGTRERISRHFTDMGIGLERIVMLGKTPWQEHMEAFNQVDIALDPFPQGGGVTALEGLMMGVPIVTLRWPTFGGRASASILTTLSLTDWIAETQEQYLEIAIEKAQNLKALTDLRVGLRDRFTASAIGNSEAYIKAVETEYRHLWQEWRGSSVSSSELHESAAPVAKMLHAPALKTALAHHQAGRLLQAEEIYRQILQAEPNHPEALHLLGVLAHQAGQNEIAADLINKAIQADPKNSNFHDHLGTVYQALNRLDEAIACHQQALALKPDEAETHYNLGNAYNNLGKLDEAVACYQKALALKPDYAEAYNNLGNTFRGQGKLNEAIVSFQGALAINPNYADAYNNLGGVFNDQRKLDEAIACGRQAVALKPDSAEVHNSLGNALCNQGQISEAIASYRTALEIDREFSKAHSNLGMALCYQGQISEAIASYRTALEIDCGFSSAHSNLIFTLDMAAGFDTPTLQQERKRWGEIHAAPLSAKQRPHTNAPAPDRRLRIGYVSADFRRHSAATAFESMLVKFDRSCFEVVAYSNTINEDQHTQLFQQNVTRWRNIVGLPDDAVAEMIREDGIDILVDLSGHTAGNRLLVFARKPAPVQVTAWGGPSGTGMPAMDALFADPVVIPPEEKQFYMEQVRYLPNLVGFFSQETFPTVGTLPALSAKTITFGSFNRLAKVSRESFELWARVLTAVPDSRLMLKTAEFDDAGTRERISRHFTDMGIDPERIVILGKTPWQEHMEAFNQVDIALDPFPQGGGTTALEGLMMGVPIVTLRWPTFGGRASASILTTLGLTDWVAETQEQYLEIAIQKVRDLAALADLRRDLRGRFMSSAIGDANIYVKAAETEYRHLWQEWCGSSASGSELHESAVPVAEMPHATPTLQAALAHHQAGRLLQAEEIYQQILQAEPNHQEALHLLGMLAHQSGQSEIALELINYAIQVNPANPLFHHNLGSVFQALNRLDEAAACYQTAIALKPDYAEAHNNLGNTFYDQGKLDAAAASYQAAIAIDPKYIEAHNNLGTTFNEQGKLDEAVACYQQALALNPDFAGSHYNLGITLKSQGKLAEALTCFQKTIEIQPNLAEAHNNMGITLHDLGKLEEAVVYLQNAIALKPDYAEAHCNLGNLLCAMGKMAEAIACYRTSIKIKPGKAHSNLIFALDLMSEADTSILQGERKKWGEIHADPLTAKQLPHANTPDPVRRLRIGYVSADFRQHSAATAFGSMLVKFDQVHFDVIAYSNTIKEDSYTQMFHQQVTRWRNIVGLSDDAVAELIRKDGIDILVDLSGHSAGNRLLAFARKPAPVQVTAWGYPSGTGMQAMDVLFADPVVIPPDEKHLYLEDVRYLPNLIGYFNPETFPAMEILPALSAKGITFGSFNRLAKLSLETFDLWAQLLLATPDSRLLFKSSEFDTPEARDRVSRHFTGAGISPNRIVMLGKTTWHEHMEAFNRIDVALDPFPHSGGITTLEGVMMGVPTVTLRRPSFGGRASASILTTLGMADWVAETPEQYIAIAIEKTRDLEALATFRRQLRSRFTSSVIGDAHAYVKAAESEYRQLWREWCERQQSQRE